MVARGCRFRHTLAPPRICSVATILLFVWSITAFAQPLYGTNLPECGFFKDFWFSLKLTFAGTQLSRQRARFFLPEIVTTQRATWHQTRLVTPESTIGVSTSQAEILLGKLKNEKNPKNRGRYVRNAVYLVPLLGSNHTAIVKENELRTEMSMDGRVIEIQNHVENEVLAYVLDRYLGTNLVPPTIMMDPSSIAQFYVEGAYPVSTKEARRTHKNLMDFSHMKLLDLFLANNDRDFPGNLMMRRGKLVAIDFDVAQPGGYAYAPDGAMEKLTIKDTLLNPQRWFAKNGMVPSVFARSVVEKLKQLDATALTSLLHKAQAPIPQKTVAQLIQTRNLALKVIDVFVKFYGEEFIIIDSP